MNSSNFDAALVKEPHAFNSENVIIEARRHLWRSLREIAAMFSMGKFHRDCVTVDIVKSNAVCHPELRLYEC